MPIPRQQAGASARSNLQALYPNDPQMWGGNDKEALDIWLQLHPDDRSQVEGMDRGFLGEMGQGFLNSFTAGIAGDHPVNSPGGWALGAIAGSLPWFAIPGLGAAKAGATAGQIAALTGGMGALQGALHGWNDAPRLAEDVGAPPPTASQRALQSALEGTIGGATGALPAVRGIGKGALLGSGLAGGQTAAENTIYDSDQSVFGAGIFGGLLGGALGKLGTLGQAPARPVPAATAPPPAVLPGASPLPEAPAPPEMDPQMIARLLGVQLPPAADGRLVSRARQLTEADSAADLRPSRIKSVSLGNQVYPVEGRASGGTQFYQAFDPEKQERFELPFTQVKRAAGLGYEVAPDRSVVMPARPAGRKPRETPYDIGGGRFVVGNPIEGMVEVAVPDSQLTIQVPEADVPEFMDYYTRVRQQMEQKKADAQRLLPRDKRAKGLTVDQAKTQMRGLGQRLQEEAGPLEQRMAAIDAALQPPPAPRAPAAPPRDPLEQFLPFGADELEFIQQLSSPVPRR